MFRKLKLLASFGALQGGVQLTSALSGFILVRVLDKRDFAAYTIATSMQVILNLLTDSGIGTGLNALGGRVWQQRDALSRLVSTAFAFRRQLAWVAVPVGAVFSLWLLRQNGMPWFKGLALALAVVLGLWGMWTTSIYAVPLRLHGRYLAVQKAELLAALLRLVLIGGLALAFLNALLAVLVFVISSALQAVLLLHEAGAVVDRGAPVDVQQRMELAALVRKQFFSTAFFAFQGQITVWLISVFGTVEKVAEVGALGRLAIIFVLVGSVMNGMVSPTFARCDSLSRLKKQFTTTLIAYCVFAGLILCASFTLPREILWILGEKYSGLTKELPWLVANGIVAGLTSVFYGLASARGWIWHAWVSPLATIALQGVLLKTLDLSEVKAALMFGFFSLVPTLLSVCYMVVRGFAASNRLGCPAHPNVT